MNKNSKVLCGLGLAMSIAVLPQFCVNAFWGWGKPKSEVKTEITDNNSIERAEAYKAYSDLSSKAYKIHIEHLKQCAVWKKAHLNLQKAGDEYQKAVALWMEASAKEDTCFSKWIQGCESNGTAYQEWVNASEQARTLLERKERAYIKYVSLTVAEKEAHEKKDQIYAKYKSALIEKANAYMVWVNICKGEEVASKEEK